MPSIRAVLFDVGNTLCHVQYRVIAEVLMAAGVSVTSEEVRLAEHRVRPLLDRFLSCRAELSTAVGRTSDGGAGTSDADLRGLSTETPDTFRHYLSLILNELDVRSGPLLTPVLTSLRDYHVRHNLWSRRDEAALPVLRSLRDKGYLLGVISNSDGQVEQLLQRVGLAEHFELIVDSGRVGVEKPHPEIFRVALQRGGLQPSEAVYVGDLYSVDVVGAARVGITGILMDPIGAWEGVSCLKARGLKEVAAIVEWLGTKGG